MSQFLRFNAEAQRKERWWGVCLQSGFLGDRPHESIANRVCGYWQKFFFKKVCHRLSLDAYIHLVKLVARTEASSSALRFRVFRGRAFFATLRKKNKKKFCHRAAPRAYRYVAKPIKSRLCGILRACFVLEKNFVYPLAQSMQFML